MKHSPAVTDKLNQLHTLILAHHIPPFFSVPSHRALAEELGTSHRTIQVYLGYLKDEGRIVVNENGKVAPISKQLNEILYGEPKEIIEFPQDMWTS